MHEQCGLGIFVGDYHSLWRGEGSPLDFQCYSATELRLACTDTLTLSQLPQLGAIDDGDDDVADCYHSGLTFLRATTTRRRLFRHLTTLRMTS